MTQEQKDKLAEPQLNLNEAPASASVKIKSKNGFEYIFTLRDEKASNLMFKIAAMEEKWMGLGWIPVAQNSGFKSNPQASQVPTKMCMVHQVEMKQKISKTSGKPYFSHSQGEYPNLTMCFGKGWQTKEQPNQNPNYPEVDYTEV